MAGNGDEHREDFWTSVLGYRFKAWWHDLQSSLWFVPTLMTIAAAIAAISLVEVDHALQSTRVPQKLPFIFSAGTAGARGVLSSIAGSVMTVTGTVFSITIVALQLASSQFTPRLLRTFTGDRSVQVVLGVFISTFTYSLLVLRTIEDGREDADPFVPHISVTLSILLALASIGTLIFFIHHVSRMIQAEVVIDRTAAETLEIVHRRYPEPKQGAPLSPETAPVVPIEDGAPVVTNDGGYLQEIDDGALLELTRERPVTLRVDHSLGDYILPGAALATIWPASALDDEIERKIQAAFIVGIERSLQADVDLGVQRLAEIALKALSPGINDPTTARNTIDRISKVLVRIANRQPPAQLRVGDDGGVVILPPIPFARLLDTAFTQIRHYGAADAVVMAHLAGKLGEIAALAPDAYRDEIAAQGRLVVASAMEAVTIPADQERVRRAGAWAETAAALAPAPGRQQR